MKMFIATKGGNGHDMAELINRTTCGAVATNVEQADIIVCWNAAEATQSLTQFPDKHHIIYSLVTEEEGVPFTLPEGCEWIYGDDRLLELSRMTKEQFLRQQRVAA